MSDEDDDAAHTKKPLELVGFRADVDLIRRVDELQAHLSEPGHRATRADVVRLLIGSGLELLEEEARRAGFAVAKENDESNL